MRSSDHRYTFNVGLLSDIRRPAGADHRRTCSSRIIFDVPTARSQGVEAEVLCAAGRALGLRLSVTVLDAKLRGSVTSTDSAPIRFIVARPRRWRASADRRASAVGGHVGYTMPVMSGSKDLFAILTWQHIGSSFSQFENEMANFGLINSALIGAGSSTPHRAGADVDHFVPVRRTSCRPTTSRPTSMSAP